MKTHRAIVALNNITFYQRFKADIRAGRAKPSPFGINLKAILKQVIFCVLVDLKIINISAPLKC